MTQTLSLGQTPPSSRSTLVLKNYISSIHTRPERATRFFQPLTVQKILWRYRKVVEWLTLQVSSMSLGDALCHITSTIFMIL